MNERFNKIGFKNCYISEITLAELQYGAECSSRPVEHKKSIEEFISQLTIIPIFSALNIYAKEKAELRKLGNMIDDFDILIGSTAIVNKMILVTDNERHFNRLNNIIIENWIER